MFRILETELTVRDSTTRLPFRYGQARMTWCPQATLRVRIETNQGAVQDGFSGDCLPPSWFDKNPEKDYPQQIDEMRQSIAAAETAFSDHFRQQVSFFDEWFQLQQQLHQDGHARGWPGLLSGFGTSMVERAVLDAIARAHGISFFQLIHDNRLSIDPARFDARLANATPQDWLPNRPRDAVFVRHTIGMADPLTASEIPGAERLSDGHPQSFEDYVRVSGIRYLKIKVGNQLESDLNRLQTIAQLVESCRGSDYYVTLDGNEQYKNANDFDALIDGIRRDSSLGTLWKNTLVIEQPLARDIALRPEHTEGIRKLSAEKPVIIDESDESLDSYHSAISVGYRGVSSKNCKGPIRSILKAGLNWHLNQSLGSNAPPSDQFVLTGEDLCCVGIVSLQSDLCLIATLGLTHVERNGHHYHTGLSYLSFEQQQAALAHHPDLYQQDGDVVWPNVVDGQFKIGSLQCPGFGFFGEDVMLGEG